MKSYEEKYTELLSKMQSSLKKPIGSKIGSSLGGVAVSESRQPLKDKKEVIEDSTPRNGNKKLNGAKS